MWEQEASVVSPELAWQATLSQVSSVLTLIISYEPNVIICFPCDCQLWSGIQTDPSLQRYREADRGWISERGSVVLPQLQRLEPVIVPSIDAALSAVITLAEASPSKRFNVFITGSLYLVGGVLSRLL